MKMEINYKEFMMKYIYWTIKNLYFIYWVVWNMIIIIENRSLQGDFLYADFFLVSSVNERAAAAWQGTSGN